MSTLEATTPYTIIIDYMGPWHQTIFYGVLGVLLYLLYPFRKVLGWAPVLFWGYVCVWALYIVEYPDLHYGEYNLAFRSTAGEAIMEALLIPLFFLKLKELEWVPKFLALLSAYILICAWGEWKGPLLATSFNLALGALTLPFLPGALLIPMLLTILLKHAGTAQMMVGAQALALSLKNKALRRWLPLIFAGLLFAVYWHVGESLPGGKRNWHSLLQGTGRVALWKQCFWYWWRDWTYVVFGTGPGSFLWMSINDLSPMKGEIWFQMHSDFFQILFELGSVGLFLALASGAQAVKNSWKDPKLLAALFGAFTFALTYHPFRFAPSCFAMAYIFRLSLVREDIHAV